MSHKIYEVGDYSSSDSEEKEISDTDAIPLSVRPGRKGLRPVHTNATNTGENTSIPITRRKEFDNDFEEEEKEDIVHRKHGISHAGDVAPAVPNLEVEQVVETQRAKPKLPDKKKNSTKGIHKGQSLTSDDAIAFMVKERQALDEEVAAMRSENNKLKADLKMKQEPVVVEKVVVDPNSSKYQADLEKLKIENTALKKKKSEMENLLRSQTTAPKAIPNHTRPKDRRKTNQKEESSSAESSSEAEENIPRKQQQSKINQTAGKKPSPKNRSDTTHGKSKVGETSNEVTLPRTGKKFSSLPSILWEGGKLWKIPYNGKGMPEERIVMIKRALRPGAQARPVRVLNKGEESRDGTASVPVAYVAYPPAIIWYNAEKPNEAKFAREIVLIEGAYLVDGHQTPAFWKLVNRGVPMPPKELCFSIVTSTRTLDLAAETLREANTWKNAIHTLLVMMTTNKDWGMKSLHRETPTWHHDSMLKETAANATSGVKPNEEEPMKPKAGVLKEQMFTATRLNNFAALDDILRSGVPVNLMEKDTGDTPLMVACRKNFPVIAKLCLDYGAKNDPHPDFGQTALHAAVASNSYDCVDVLLDAAAPSGADVTISTLPDPQGETPLHTAASLGYGKIAELLISHGAQLSSRNTEGKNAVHLSSVAGHRGCLAIMLDQGGDELIEERDSNGNTALHLAAEFGHLNVAKLLLETAANPSVRNGRGLTPYAIASAKGHHQVGILLLEYSASGSSPAAKRSNQSNGRNQNEPGLGRRAISDSRAQLEEERLRYSAFGVDNDDATSGGTFSLDVHDHAGQSNMSHVRRQNSFPLETSSGLPRPHSDSTRSAYPGRGQNALQSPLAAGGHRGSNDYMQHSEMSSRGGMHSARDYSYSANSWTVDASPAPLSARERPAPALFEGMC